MLKKALVLALAINTFSIQPSQVSTKPNDFAVTCAATALLTVAGVAATWIACKDFKKGWYAGQEFERQLKNLNEMGVKVYTVTTMDVEFGALVMKERYKMEIPSHFSQEQKKQAKEHWRLFLANDKDFNNMLSWPAVASVLMIPTAIAGMVECIKLSGVNFNKS